MNRIFLGLVSTSFLFSVSHASPLRNVEINHTVTSSSSSLTAASTFRQAQQNLIGEVTAIDAAGGKISVKTEGGSVVSVTTNDKTTFRRVLPGQTSIANAEQVTFAAISIGDRLLVPGATGNEAAPARQVIVMARTAINAQRDQEREARRARTFAGRVTAVNPEKKEIIMQSRGRAADAENVTVAASGNVKFLRYAPDSLKLTDAVAGTFSDVRVGDQIRIVGDRSPEGQTITAEEIFSGSITRAVGSIVEVNTAANEVVVKDGRTGQNITVALGKNTTLRRISDEAAASLTQRREERESRRRERQNNSQNGDQAQQASREARRENRRQNGGENGARQQGQGNRQGGMNRLFENLPAVTIADLKKGDAVMITATGSAADNSRLTAVSLITGDADLQQVLLRTQGGGRNGPGSPGLPGNVGGGNQVNDPDEPRNRN